MSKFKLDKIVIDIANFQRIELKKKSKIKKKKDITIKELEKELENALDKLIEKDNKEINNG
tara:strand:+ start:406 stop:588 length:183 start_codon:yes stop_codon:yes gene_type:complete